MPFTEDDNCREILLKVMIAEAWRQGGPSDEDRDVIEDWITALAVEGPERVRVLALLNRRVDEFQAQIYDGQLKALLASSQGCDRLDSACSRVMQQRRRPFVLESRLAERIDCLLRDRSAIQRLVEEAREGGAAAVPAAGAGARSAQAASPAP